MAWEPTEWACGHTGAMQLYGKMSGRDARVAWEAGRQCMACWLVGEWKKQGDPRAKREDRYILAGKIAEGKGKRIYGLDTEHIADVSTPATQPSEDVQSVLS